MVWGRVVFMMFSCYTAQIRMTIAGQDCTSCYQSLCGNVTPGNCRLLATNGSSTNNDLCDENCLQIDSIIECRSNEKPQVRNFKMADTLMLSCIDTTVSTESTASTLQPGFYIAQHVRFCEAGCIRKFLLRYLNSINPSVENPLQLHIFKQYGREFEDFLFFEKVTFNVTLTRNVARGVFEALPPSNQQVCVSIGDNIGLTLREDISISVRLVSPSYGMYSDLATTTCTGFDFRIFEINIPVSAARVPYLSVEYHAAPTTNQPTPKMQASPEMAATDNRMDTLSIATTLFPTTLFPTTATVTISTASDSGVTAGSNVMTIIISSASAGTVIIVMVVAAIIIISLSCFFLVDTRKMKELDRRLSSVDNSQYDVDKPILRSAMNHNLLELPPESGHSSRSKMKSKRTLSAERHDLNDYNIGVSSDEGQGTSTSTSAKSLHQDDFDIDSRVSDQPREGTNPGQYSSEDQTLSDEIDRYDSVIPSAGEKITRDPESGGEEYQADFVSLTTTASSEIGSMQ